MNGQDLESSKHCGNTNEFGGLHSLWRIEQEKTRLVEFNKETYNAVPKKNHSVFGKFCNFMHTTYYSGCKISLLGEEVNIQK